ncbi:hypothetical protein KC220_24485, partial [Mycobacterium tuberculosis]|nr:hypothetical protein [Mycobacterium tuberculosis]
LIGTLEQELGISKTITVYIHQFRIYIFGKSKTLFFFNESFSFAEIKYMTMNATPHILQQTPGPPALPPPEP